MYVESLQTITLKLYNINFYMISTFPHNRMYALIFLFFFYFIYTILEILFKNFSSYKYENYTIVYCTFYMPWVYYSDILPLCLSLFLLHEHFLYCLQMKYVVHLFAAVSKCL